MASKFDVNNDSIIKNRQCAALILVVNGANPNGDPDQGGAPRMTALNEGFITPQSFKQKLRATLADHNSPVFNSLVELFGIKNTERFHIFESLHRGYSGLTPRESLQHARQLFVKDEGAAIDRYFDCRVFGGTNLDDKNATGPDGTSMKMQFKRTGPVTISAFRSIGPIISVDSTITKMAPMRESVIAKEAGDMAPGAYKFVPFAVYYAMLSVNPNVAEATKTTIGDIELLKGLLKYAYLANESATRPAGTISFKHIWWANHTNALGSFNETEFFEAMRPKFKGNPSGFPSSLEDFEFPSLPNGMDVVDLA